MGIFKIFNKSLIILTILLIFVAISSNTTLPVNETQSTAAIVSETLPEVNNSDDYFLEESNYDGIIYVGSKNSNKFHYQDCEWAYKIKSYNLVEFYGIDDAFEYGYIPCKVCRPY